MRRNESEACMHRDIAARRILCVILMGIVCLVPVLPLNAADQNPTEISRLLSLARLEAIRLREDTNQMRNFVLNDVTWETHAVYATMILDDIRAMREKVEQLDMARNSGRDWQKSVIDQIHPLMNELATTTEEICETVNDRPFDRTLYNGYLETNFDHAEKLAALISDSVHYGNAKVWDQKNREKLHSTDETN